MATSITTVTTGEARLSYLHLFQPFAKQTGQEPKYSLTVLVPKTDTATKAAIDRAVEAAAQYGTASKWSGVRPPQLAVSVHDGDSTRPSDGMPFGDECKGHWVFTASSKNQPFVVGPDVQPIIDPTKAYSGVYGRVSVNFFPYFNAGKKGIGCGLNGVQILRDGEPLGNHVTAAEAFGLPVTPAAPMAVDPITGLPMAAL